jgi:hypothetical protein
VPNLPGFKEKDSWSRLHEIKIALLLTLATLQICLVPYVMAGPPLAIDDPGILEPGSWEVILAVSGLDFGDSQVTQAPLLDVSYGLTSNTQLSFSLPRVDIDTKHGKSKAGLDFAMLGYKWRFAANSNWEWAIAANYSFLVSHELIRANGPEDVRTLGLPLLVSHSRGDWTWLGQAGWNSGSNGINFWDYGVAVSHPWSDSVTWMIEAYGIAASSFNHQTLNYQFGLDFEMRPGLHLLAAAGSRIKTDSNHGEGLNFNYYAGVQWFPR